MALRFMDSFDHYATADLPSKYQQQAGSPSINATGRFSNALVCGDVDRIVRTIDSQATWIVGAAVYMPNITHNSARLFTLIDSATGHLDVRWASDNSITVTRNGTVLGTSSVLSHDTWYYFEFKGTIADAGGVAVLRINGVTEVNFSGDTRNAANASADRIQIGNATAGVLGSGLRFDDLYICDGTGSAPTNDFLGDCRVQSRLPNGNGNSSQFDGSDGNTTDNYLLVDDATQDGDTTYVQSPDVGDKDTYAYEDLTPTSGTVYGVQALPYARKTDAGARSICSVARLSGTETDSSNKALSTSYLYYPDIREAKPGGGSWSISDVNNAEFGQKVTV